MSLSSLLSKVELIECNVLSRLFTDEMISAVRVLIVVTNSAVFARAASACLAPILYIAESCLLLSAVEGIFKDGFSSSFESVLLPKSNSSSLLDSESISSALL